MNRKIICVGGITIDRKLTSKHPLQLRTSNPVSSISTFGGVAHNVAKNLALLTDNVHLCSVVGQDNHGLEALANLKRLNIHIQNILTLHNQPTAHYDVILDNEGELFLALADMDIFDHVPFSQFTQSWHEWNNDDLVFLDSNLPQTIIEYAIHMARTQNIKICIDPVSVSKAQKLPPCLEHIFLLKPDRFEAEALTDMRIHSVSDCIKAGKLLLDKGVKNCIISLGKAGYVLINERIQQHFPAFSINPIVDVSGAGDAFIAGILYELKHNAPIIDACQTGAAMAALTIQSSHTVNEHINHGLLKKIQLSPTERELDHATVF
ncbi:MULTISPECIES: carbohydrate kinase family protein [Legionella]|uniref:Carbohydrate kinase, pfkB family n=1 Tax=Legionella steelei TaxID=947033 RepID=A0A0W0ZQJ2_9GAMM|nr:MULTISPECIES: carbohydrate kinase family protein [Legionella]KTD71493.1 carbohydrate kinase, pfkB family [Legionella steelei]MBN9228369.1 carbohydrate kinase family protein [Legionella steelei]OJW09244.1 MAG: carbohydrate kinase [Legionella sp. 39-23]